MTQDPTFRTQDPRFRTQDPTFSLPDSIFMPVYAGPMPGSDDAKVRCQGPMMPGSDARKLYMRPGGCI